MRIPSTGDIGVLGLACLLALAALAPFAPARRPAGLLPGQPRLRACSPARFRSILCVRMALHRRGLHGAPRRLHPGSKVTPIEGPSENWTRLRAAGADAFQRDRAAILAMAGDYRASFDFLETAVFIPGKRASPARPYRSWGTERIYVAADSGAFISLQHIMVMFFEDEKGVRQGPMVMKHWRQDWRYEPASLSRVSGPRTSGPGATWARRSARAPGPNRCTTWTTRPATPRRDAGSITPPSRPGAALPTRRPAPRREHTVRSDYQVLEARNRHTIMPTGWLHEQDNLKLASGFGRQGRYCPPYLAREAGVDRYDLIQGFDFSAGDAYWKATSPFWSEVRARWAAVLGGSSRLRADDMRTRGADLRRLLHPRRQHGLFSPRLPRKRPRPWTASLPTLFPT